MDKSTIRASWAFLLWLVIASSPGYPGSDKIPVSPTRSSTSLNRLLNRIVDTSDRVKDLTAQVDFQLELQPVGINFHVSGDIYYKQPNRVRIKLHGLSEFLMMHQNDAVKTTEVLANLRRNIIRDYDAVIINDTRIDGDNCMLIRLTPKAKSNISSLLVWINPENCTIPQVMALFNDGSTLTQKKHYTVCDSVYVVQEMKSTFESNKDSAQILATFSNYQINKGVADSVFQKSSSGSIVSTF